MSSKLNVAIVGLGIGEKHLEAYLKNRHCLVRYVCDSNDQKVKEINERYKFNFENTPFEKIVNDPSIHIVSIASYDSHHAEQVIPLINKGKHVFVEKPLCTTQEDLEKIFGASCNSPEVVIKSNLILKTAPLYKWLKEEIDKGSLGDIYAFDGDYLYGRKYKITEGWRSQDDNYSIMAGGGIHCIDMMLYLLGQKPEKVFAHSNKVATKNTSFQFDDFCSAEFYFSSGIIGRITANFGCVQHHQHCFRIFGTKGVFIYDDQGARISKEFDKLAYCENNTNTFLKVDKYPLPCHKGDLIAEFIDDISLKRKTSLNEFNLMSIIFSCNTSVRLNELVKIHYYY